MNRLVLLVILLVSLISCNGQNSETNKKGHEMSEQKNPLICDIESGTCETPESSTKDQILANSAVENKIRVVYFTDPICSSCWGIEPQLRKLKLEYGKSIEIEYRMGGLLPDWSYNSGGISKPSDVAHHWDEVSIHYDMPIDGDVWIEDPLDSSYPPSIAFKAAQMQDSHKAIDFLREIREMVFLEKKNITKWEYLATAAKKVGLDENQLKIDYEGRAADLFKEDLQKAKEFGVRGFPTMFFINPNGESDMVYGSKPYSNFENAVLRSDPDAAKSAYSVDPVSLFSVYNSLTAKEFSVLSGINREECDSILDSLVDERVLSKITTKNGSIWRLK